MTRSDAGREAPVGNTSDGWGFDGAALSAVIRDRRMMAGLTTRQLAQSAQISQAYVTKLERARHADGESSPVPTIAVVARLAAALGIDPVELFTVALQPPTRHVLLITDRPGVHALDAARRGVGAWRPDDWVTTSSSSESDQGDDTITIGLHRWGADDRYDTAKVVRALSAQLTPHASRLRGRRVGMVFTEQSDYLNAGGDAQPLLDFERRWGDVASRAANRVKARPLWNVCAYDPRALASQSDPDEVALSLLRTHDEVWATTPNGLLIGRAAGRHLLTSFRANRRRTGRASRNESIERILDTVGLEC